MLVCGRPHGQIHAMPLKQQQKIKNQILEIEKQVICSTCLWMSSKHTLHKDLIFCTCIPNHITRKEGRADGLCKIQSQKKLSKTVLMLDRAVSLRALGYKDKGEIIFGNWRLMLHAKLCYYNSTQSNNSVVFPVYFLSGWMMWIAFLLMIKEVFSSIICFKIACSFICYKTSLIFPGILHIIDERPGLVLMPDTQKCSVIDK